MLLSFFLVLTAGDTLNTHAQALDICCTSDAQTGENITDKNDTKMVHFGMMIPRGELERLRQAAKDDGRSTANYVRRAVVEKIERG